MTFIRNTWYVAGWVPDPSVSMFSRTIVSDRIVFFRKSADAWAAITNRCPHRFAPLDKGKVIEGQLQCGYHGLRFDEKGHCVHNPIGNGVVPRAARVRAYAVVERHKLLWVWPGDANEADPALIPDYSILDNPEWAHATGGYIHCEANYQLLVDNLLDLSHVAFLHPLFGTESMSRGKPQVSEHGSTIQSNFWMSEIASPPFFEPRFRTGSAIDHWLDMRWSAPSNLLLDFGATDVGQPRAEGIHGWASHILTPETETSVHYFFSMSRPKGPGAEAAAAAGHDAQKSVFFTEDKPMVEACQQAMGSQEFWSLRPVLLAGDSAAVRARREIERLIQKESQQMAVAASAEVRDA